MPPTQLKIVVAEALSQEAIERLRRVGEVVQLPACERATLRSAVSDCTALVVRSYAPVDAGLIEGATQLRVIARAGSGVENIDTRAAAAAGIVVVHTPAAATHAVAELTIGFIIALERKLIWSDQQIRQGCFLDARDQVCGRQLGDMALGIIGFGRIGRRVAEIAHAGWRMPILFNDIRTIDTAGIPAASVSKEQLYASADVVSLHVPLTEQTRHLINAQALAGMKRDALLINTSRGSVVDAQALAAALYGGQIAGAAVDVFSPEPPDDDHPLLGAPNCLLSPHAGARTHAALLAMNDVVDDVIAVIQGRAPQYPYAAP